VEFSGLSLHAVECTTIHRILRRNLLLMRSHLGRFKYKDIHRRTYIWSRTVPTSKRKGSMNKLEQYTSQAGGMTLGLTN
jgi:hypothetical protein